MSARRLQNLSLGVASVLAYAVAIEVLLRTTHLLGAHLSYSQPDSVLAFRYVPYAQYYFHQENPRAIKGRINRYGWRDRNWTIAKPPGTIRIALLGDSFVEAFQVEQDSTFGAILQDTLSRRPPGRTIEVLNFGRSGFTQSEELLVLQSDVLRFSPDVVVLCFLPANDIEDVRRETAPDPVRPFFTYTEPSGEVILDTGFRETRGFRTRSALAFFKRHSAFLSVIADRYTAYRIASGIRRRTAAGAKADGIRGPMSLCTAHPDSALARSYALNKTLIERIAGICRGAGAELLLVSLPTDAYRVEREREYAGMDSTFDAFWFDDDLQRFASALGIRCVGLQRVFREESGLHGRPLTWKHLNYEGHRVTAAALAGAIEPLLEPGGRREP